MSEKSLSEIKRIWLNEILDINRLTLLRPPLFWRSKNILRFRKSDAHSQINPQVFQTRTKKFQDHFFENHNQKIFDKFELVKLQKTGIVVGASGLGLAFCKLSVEAHGGRIWVESEGQGKGAKFQFTPTLQKPRTSESRRLRVKS